VSEVPAPRLLLIETSGRSGFVAVAHGADLRGLHRLDEARRHARDLAPAAAQLLAAQGWRPRDVQAVVVSRGPGSYTGLRVGIMAAKTFAYATGSGLVALETFAVIASQAPDEVACLDVLADAQQDKVYVQPFTRTPEGWQPVASLTIRRFAEWLAGRDAAAWVTGPGLHRWGEQLPAGSLVIEAGRRDATPEAVLRLGLARWDAGGRDDVWALEPLYLRPSSAEELWQARGQRPGADPG
jgi:tRNA threonylcarbamoyladenosine biosynthesis protein TsaB